MAVNPYASAWPSLLPLPSQLLVADADSLNDFEDAEELEVGHEVDGRVLNPQASDEMHPRSRRDRAEIAPRSPRIDDDADIIRR